MRARAPLRVVALATFPVAAAATRFRIAQFVPHFSGAGVDVTLLPFLSDAAFRNLYDRKALPRNVLRFLGLLLRRVAQLPRILRARVVFVQREAMLVGPPWIEWLTARVARVPMVLDLDDPTWIPFTSPVYGRFGTLLKWPSKAERLIRWAAVVVCGNETIAEYVRGAGVPAVVLPTIVDTDVFTPREGERHDLPVVGWIGTHSTFPYVEALLPLLEQVAASFPFRLRIIGSGRSHVNARGIDVEMLPWRLDREVDDFQSFDVGLYPMPEDSWTAGKSGLKLVQYLATGVPSIASPVGIIRSIGVAGVTHLTASTPDEWRRGLERLLGDAGERRAMSAAGRRYAVENYSVAEFAARLATVLRAAADRQAEAFA